MERLNVARIGCRCAEHLLRLEIGKVYVIRCYINVGVGPLCKLCVAAAVIFHHT